MSDDEMTKAMVERLLADDFAKNSRRLNHMYKLITVLIVWFFLMITVAFISLYSCYQTQPVTANEQVQK